MKISKYILLFLFVAFCFTDCKKYPDGGWIMFNKPYKRLTNIWWAVEYWEVNGVDSTATFLARPCISGGVNNAFSFNSKKGTSSLQGGCMDEGNFDFSKPYKNITIKKFSYSSSTSPTILAPFSGAGSIEWSILKLTNSNFWIKTNYSGNDYIIHFKN